MMNTIQTPKRPTRRDEAVIRAAARELAPAVKGWLAESNDITGLEAIENDLMKAMKYEDDGYEIAKGLEPNYSPDAALVEILDGAVAAKHRAVSRACAEWVTANGIEPIPLGTRVIWPKCHTPGPGVGLVTFNHPDGRATVMFSSLGHVPEGVGTHGFVVAWEELVVEP